MMQEDTTTTDIEFPELIANMSPEGRTLHLERVAEHRAIVVTWDWLKRHGAMMEMYEEEEE